ncbi:glycosyltransferase family 9 protein [Leptolyngbya sp. NIES-2104]|uniref:glycosyltransferase family 9 protein n=1 Tax=Leptolyngbya sp. NIES-2104 TaxID=1552121 RepID=UPI001CEDFBD0|nr:glycosyltransferase family 9 protein [Leptolyngbya sp. NIES-2104]
MWTTTLIESSTLLLDVNSRKSVSGAISNLEKIAIVRALPGLGDFLCAVPALRALRTAFPQTKITLIGLPNSQSLGARFEQYIDEFVALPGYPGLPEQPANLEALPEFFEHLRSRQFDLAVQMHGSGIVTNPLTLELGAARTIGFFQPSQPCPDPASFLPFVETEHEILRYLRLLEFVGIPASDSEMEFPIADADRQEFQTLSQIHGLQRYACIHAGASVPSRCWSSDRFAQIAEYLSQRGWQIVLTGTCAERGLTESIARLIKAPTINLAGRTSLGTLAALLEGCKLLVCNDTGISHLAAALKVPSVVIFSGSDPQRWSPLDKQRHRSIVPPASVSDVVEQVEFVLQQESLYVA